MEWSLIVVILRIDISLNTIDSILIEKVPNFLLILLANRVEKLLIGSILHLPPVFPRDQVL